jgi:hypothetical protein
VAGFRLDLAQDELPVDNFFTEIFFNDFNAQPAKSCKSMFFIDFRRDRALFQCPAKQGVKKSPTSADQLSQHSEYSDPPENVL